MTDWKETKMANKPDAIMLIGAGLFMQCRNIKFVSDEEGYICETREVSESELKLLGEIDALNRATEALEANNEALEQANAELSVTVDSILTEVLPSLMGL